MVKRYDYKLYNEKENSEKNRKTKFNNFNKFLIKLSLNLI